MKNLNILLLFALSIILVSCVKDDDESGSRNCEEVEYGKEFEIQMDEEVCFPNGYSLILTNVEHQLCPCEVVCVWEGDLWVTLMTLIDSDTKVKEFHPRLIETEPGIFTNHLIKAVSYRYDSTNGEVPPCAEDFDSKKVTLKLTISED